MPVTGRALLVPDGCSSPYSGLSLVPSTVPFLAQQVLAWLVRWDPRLQLIRPASHHVFLPVSVQSKGQFGYRILACDRNTRCLQESVSVDRLVVACTCLGQMAAVERGDCGPWVAGCRRPIILCRATGVLILDCAGIQQAGCASCRSGGRASNGGLDRVWWSHGRLNCLQVRPNFRGCYSTVCGCGLTVDGCQLASPEPGRNVGNKLANTRTLHTKNYAPHRQQTAHCPPCLFVAIFVSPHADT